MKRSMTLKAASGMAAVAVLLATQAMAVPIVTDTFTGAQDGWVNSLGNVSGLAQSGNVLTWNSTFPGAPLAEVETTANTPLSNLVNGGNNNWTTLLALSLSFDFTSTQPAGTILEIYFADTTQGGNWRYQFLTSTSGSYQTDLDFNFGTGWYFDAGPSIQGNFTSALTSVDLVGISISGITLNTTFTLDNVTLDDTLTGGASVSYVPEPGTYAALAMIFICLATGFRDQLREGFAKLSLARSSGTPA